MKISAVVNTYNEEKNIERCLKSVENLADEIILVDMHSTDKTVEIAKRHQAKIFQHEYTRFVEPARNFALSKATGDWIFLIDADEELSKSLAAKLNEVAEENKADYVEIPRKNIIFNKWIEHSRWWPDFLIRFFRKGKVRFSDEIHVAPTAEGERMSLEPKEELAIIHHHLQTISQYLERLNRYTDIQSEEINKKGYQFKIEDLILKPSNEFFSRFFAGEGYKDSLHGLILAALQGFSEFVVYLKVWELQGFHDQNIKDTSKWFKKVQHDFFHWQQKISSDYFEKILLKIKSKI